MRWSWHCRLELSLGRHHLSQAVEVPCLSSVQVLLQIFITSE